MEIRIRPATTAGAIIAMLLAQGIAQSAQPPTMSIVLTGQSLLQADTRIDTPTVVQTIRPLLNGDVVFTNLEATIAEEGDDLSGFNLKVSIVAPPASLDVLRDMGVNLLALSDNHSLNLGLLGLANTIREVKARKLANAGIGMNLEEATAPGYLHTPKGTVALVSMATGQIPPGGIAEKSKPGVNELRLEGGTPGIDAGHPNPEDAKRILQSIREAAKHADLVIAYQHNHSYDPNFQTMFREELPDRLVPPKWIKAWAYEEIDAGADIVVLHGAPILQGVEIYRGKPIFYDLGNFIFNLPLWVDWFEPIAWESVVAHAEFQGKTLKSISFEPIVLNPTGRGEGALALHTRGLPAPAGDRSGYILQRLVDGSRKVGTTVEVNCDTATVKLDTAAPNP